MLRGLAQFVGGLALFSPHKVRGGLQRTTRKIREARVKRRIEIATIPAIQKMILRFRQGGAGVFEETGEVARTKAAKPLADVAMG